MLAEASAAAPTRTAGSPFVKHDTVKPSAPVRPDRSTQTKPDDLTRFMRRIVTDAVSRMALIDADRRVPQSHSPSTWRASRA